MGILSTLIWLPIVGGVLVLLSERFSKAEEELIEIINQDIGHFAATKQGAIEEVELVAMSVFLICWPFVSCLQAGLPDGPDKILTMHSCPKMDGCLKMCQGM